jgi:tetratricopeptide (TPR) repeat protein
MKDAATIEKTYPLPDAADYIVNALEQNKLVFIGEDHSIVNEEIFMAENLQAFYDVGLRYIFRESFEEEEGAVGAENLQAFHDIGVSYFLVKREDGQPPSPGSPNYRIMTFPPWRNDVGGGIETGLFNQAIRNINNVVPKQEQIRQIPSEAGYTGNDLNKRDKIAFKNISEFMGKIPANKKAMVFYGYGHGQKKPTEMKINGGEPFLWTPLGARLKERYGDGFISIYLTSNKDDIRDISLDIAQLKDSESKPKIVLPNTKSNVINNSYIQRCLSRYDAVIVDRETMFSTGPNYAPTYENLFAMYNGLYYLENNINNWKNDVAIYRFQDQGQYLQYIYYLKLWLGDRFDYRLWDTKKSLHAALNELNGTVFMKNDTIKDISVAFNMQQMNNYCKAMLMSGVGGFIYDDFDPAVVQSREDILKLVFPRIADYMKEAIALFPQDLWSYYWLAYAETELENYDEAIKQWEYIIEQPLAYCMETLPRVYRQLSKCYAAKGDYAKSDMYKKMGESLKNEHNLVIENLNDVK